MLDTCNKLIDKFENPYLKAVFNYIINKDEAITKILVTNGIFAFESFFKLQIIFIHIKKKYDRKILFQDRVALSVYFMFSQDRVVELQSYFDRLIEDECVKNADLHGILLTGLGPQSIDLFQAFIDKTSDIQTASLAIIHSPYLDVLNSKQVQYWINCYRDQLNRFKYWERRLVELSCV